jgi:hypothetical protein
MRGDADLIIKQQSASTEAVLQKIRETIAFLQDEIDEEERRCGTCRPSDWRYPASAQAMRARRDNLISTTELLQAGMPTH